MSAKASSNPAVNRPPVPSLSVDSSSSSLSFHYLSKLLLRRLWLLGSLLFIALALAFVYLHTATPFYRSVTVVQVEQEQQRVYKPDTKGDVGDDLKSDDSLKTIEQNLQSSSLFLAVASDPRITKDPLLYKGISPHGRPLSTSDLADILQGNTHATLRRGTRLIDVSVDHPVPEVAQKLSHLVVEDYISGSSEVSVDASTGIEGQLLTDSDGIKRKLQKSEDALATYREVLLLKDRISDQQRIIDALQQRYRAKHPAMIQARTLMSELVVDFDREVKRIRTDSLETAYWAEQDDALKGLSPQDRIETELQLVEARTNVLDGEVETERTLFNNVLKQTSEAAISKGAAPTDVRIVSDASLPQRPVRPRKSIILALGFAAGLGLGLAFVFLIDTLDSSFKMAEDVEQYLALPVLGTVPLLPRSAESSGGRPKDRALENVPLVTDPSGMGAESFRSIRASLSLLGRKEDHRTFLFTSALSGEGKTFISTNYAVSLAQQGIKTLLMDIDLRCPSVHHFFKIPNGSGLVDHVAQGTPLAKSVHPNVVPNLDVLTAGTKCPNPAEFLAGKGFEDTLKEALLQYDRLVIDCSPINLVSDPLLIMSHVQSVVLVIRANRTARKDAKFALNLLHRAEIEPVGVIINAVPDWTRDLYYSHPGRYGDGEKYFRAYS